MVKVGAGVIDTISNREATVLRVFDDFSGAVMQALPYTTRERWLSHQMFNYVLPHFEEIWAEIRFSSGGTTIRPLSQLEESI